MPDDPPHDMRLTTPEIMAVSVREREGKGACPVFCVPRSPHLSLSPPPSYTDVAKSQADDLKELTTLRGMACGKRSSLAMGTLDDEGEPAEDYDEHARWLVKYLSALAEFEAKYLADPPPRDLPGGGVLTVVSAMFGGGSVASKLVFDWSSAAACTPSTFTRVIGIVAERAATRALLAAALRGAGAAAAAATAKAGGDAAALVAAAGLFRRAAGLYGAVADAAAVPDGGAPAELTAAVAAALGALSLADAQALAATKADLAGLSPSSVASLHVGAVGLYKAAADALNEAGYAPLASAAAAGATLAAARARKAAAAAHYKDLDPGKSIAELKEATSALVAGRSAARFAGPLAAAAWAAVFDAETAAIKAASIVLERERTVVYLTPIPAAAAPLPPARVVVAAAPLTE